MSNSSNSPTDLRGQVDNLATTDSVIGSVMNIGDFADAFSFTTPSNLTGTTSYDIPFQISNFNLTGGANNGYVQIIAGASGTSVTPVDGATISGDGFGVLQIANAPASTDYRFIVGAQSEDGTVAYDYQLGAVPEPTTALLLGVAAATALLRCRRRKVD